MPRRPPIRLVTVRPRRRPPVGFGSDGALYRSTDAAEHGTKLKLPEGVNGPHGPAADPRDPRRLFLAAWGRRPDADTVGGGIYLSSDAGGTWRNVLAKDQYVYDITLDPRDPNILYACGFQSSAWRSADHGESRRRIKGFNFKWGQRVIPDPADAGKIYITTYGGSLWHGPAEGDDNASEDLAVPERPAR
jgi:hypothetical protein